MKYVKLKFFTSAFLCMFFIIWGGFEFTIAKGHGSAHLLFIIGLIILAQAVIFFFLPHLIKYRKKSIH